MCKSLLPKVLIITCGILILISVPHRTNANDIYKWTDETGKVHFTDNPALIPKDREDEVEIIKEVKKRRSEDQSKYNLAIPTPTDDLLKGAEEDLETDKEEATRVYWRSRALEIDNEEKRILEDISRTRNLIKYKKREVDYMLTNGYHTDRSIFELRNLENRLQQLESDLDLLKPEKAKLQEDARRAGVPPGYLRP